MDIDTKVTPEMPIEEVAAAVLHHSRRGEVEGETTIFDWLAEGEIVGFTIEELVAEWDSEFDYADEEDEELEEEWDDEWGY